MRNGFIIFFILGGMCGTSLGQSRGINIEPVTTQPTPYLQGVYRALVIGNNRYEDKHKRWPSLKTAESDAKAVAEMLAKQYGFTQVDLLLNASRKDILHGLERLAKKVQSNDSVLVYYAGHGFLDPGTGKGYWVPSDAVGSDTSTFLHNSTIRDELSVIADRVQHTLLISDSCFSGSLLGSAMRGVSSEDKNEHYYKKVAAKKRFLGSTVPVKSTERIPSNTCDDGRKNATY